MGNIENTGVSNERLILTLLREDLRSNKLLLGLEQLGVDAERYTLDVSDLVFELMGCSESEANALMDVYREAMDQAVTIQDVEEGDTLEKMAQEAYEKLITARQSL